VGELHPVNLYPVLAKALGVTLRGTVSGIAGIVGDPDALHLLHGPPKLVREALDAEQAGDVLEAVYPER
jgi:hypothetical protein